MVKFVKMYKIGFPFFEAIIDFLGSLHEAIEKIVKRERRNIERRPRREKENKPKRRKNLERGKREAENQRGEDDKTI
jgi:hypothetical protein